MRFSTPPNNSEIQDNSASKKEEKPSDLTLNIIRQFARTCYVEPSLSLPAREFIIN